MSPILQGSPVACHGRVAIVVSRFNESNTEKLGDGAQATLREKGVGESQVDVAWIPGAFEVPVVAARMASSSQYQAVLCLGAVIHHGTTHGQDINRAVSLGLMRRACAAACLSCLGF